RPMTPPYASPEQIQGQPITTASDVYSLGVLLYKLLTGRLPFSTRDLPRHELERVLVESLPERPSRAITRPGSNDRAANLPATRRRGRAGRVQQLQRQLKGDLDNIVLMALRKEPERRYSSVDQLMEDLHRHLVGRPVAARRDTFFYRSGKLLKRNKVAAGIAGSSLVLLTGFAVAMARQAIQVTRQRDLARQEREKAERTAGFLADTFALADPYNAEGAPATLLEILQAGEVRLEDELANQPEIRTRLMVTIGSIYRRRGHYKKATRLLKRALSVQESLLGQHHIDTSTALNELALSHQEGGSLKNARILLQRALAIRRKLLPADDNGNAEVLVNLAATDLINGDLASAESLVKESLKILNKDSVTNPTLLARAFDLSSMVHLRRGEYEQAEATRRLGLSLMKSTADTDPRQMAIAVVHQGNYYCVRNDLKRAVVAFRRALAMFQRAVGQSHPDVAVTLTNIGACHSMAGEYQRAKRLYLRAIKILEKTVGPHHRDVAILLCRLGILYRRKGKFDQASSYLDRALENFEQVEQNYQNIAYALFQRARVFVECMDLSSGEMLYRQAAEIQRHRLGPKNQQLLETLTALSELLVQQGRNEEANTLYRQVIDTTRQATEGDPENCRTRTIRAAALMGLGDLFMATGQEQKAAQQWSQALDIMETQVASAWVVESRDIHCRTLLRLGQIAEAKPIVEELLSIGWCCSDFLDRCRQHGLLPTPPADESSTR
ncbi:MAG: tetratricopeptide repeat protein, partial [Acidobacteriota bacterium]